MSAEADDKKWQSKYKSWADRMLPSAELNERVLQSMRDRAASQAALQDASQAAPGSASQAVSQIPPVNQVRFLSESIRTWLFAAAALAFLLIFPLLFRAGKASTAPDTQAANDKMKTEMKTETEMGRAAQEPMPAEADVYGGEKLPVVDESTGITELQKDREAALSSLSIVVQAEVQAGFSVDPR